MTAIRLGTNQILLSQTEWLRHRDMVELVRIDKVVITVVLYQQRPNQAVRISRLSLREVGTISVVVLCIEVQHPLRRYIVGVEVGVVVREVQERRANHRTWRLRSKAYTPDNLGCEVVVPHILEETHSVGIYGICSRE